MVSGPGTVVADTSVVSIIFNSAWDGRAPYYESHLAGLRVAISFQTLEELHFWPLASRWGDIRRNELMRHLEQYEVIWPDEALVDISAQLRFLTRSEGRELKTADAWIAATALYLNCPLAADDGDFESIPNLALIRMPRA